MAFGGEPNTIENSKQCGAGTNIHFQYLTCDVTYEFDKDTGGNVNKFHAISATTIRRTINRKTRTQTQTKY